MPSAVEEQPINQLTAGEVSTSAAAESVVATVVEKAMDISALLLNLMHSHAMKYYLIVSAQVAGTTSTCCVSTTHYCVVAHIGPG